MKRRAIRILGALLSTLEDYRWWIFGFIYLTGFGIYKIICHANWLESAYYAVALFALDVNTSLPLAPDGVNSWLYLIGLLAAFYTVISFISLLTKQFIDSTHIKISIREPYILVCGLGHKASAYIDSELISEKHNIIAIEKNPQNPNIEHYRNKGVAVKVGNATDIELLKTLNLDNAQHIVSLAGKDTENLDIALIMRDVLKDQEIPSKKLYMHIDNRELDKFYKDGGLLDDSAKLEIKVFSMSRNSAKTLFLEHDIDGLSREYMDSDKPFSIVVAGYSKLAIEVVRQACEIAHLPNENKMTIYCIDKDIENYKKAIMYHFSQIEMIPNISIEYLSLEYNAREFYEDEVWGKELTNIMLCYEDEQTNLNVAAELADSTYLEQIVVKSMRAKIHIAIYDNKMIAENINLNNIHFKYFNVFAQTSKMASRQEIVDESFEIIARCIHSGYDEKYNPDAMFGNSNEIDEKWGNTARLTDRISTRAQANHIPVKLKALGLKMHASKKSQADLLVQNRSMLIKRGLADELKTLGLDIDTLKRTTEKYEGDDIWDKIVTFPYFPSKYKLLMEKLIRLEHNRWNAHHYLKGWVLDKDRTNKAIKAHRCLVPIAKMDNRDRFTVLYDMYAVLYMPNLLAKAGYEIVSAKSVR